MLSYESNTRKGQNSAEDKPLLRTGAKALFTTCLRFFTRADFGRGGYGLYKAV